MFHRHRKYADGYESECRECKRSRYLLRDLRKVIAAIFSLVIFCGVASAQEQLPEHLGDTYVQGALVLMRPNGSRAGVWFDKGFGSYGITLTSATNWQLTIGGQPYLYTLFRIRNDTELADDYWVCERATWTAYLTHKNVTTLKNASWQFGHFTLTSDYLMPDFAMPVTWENRTNALSIGHAPDNTLAVIQKEDGTWEWTVRGTRGVNTWQAAETQVEARSAAQTLYDVGQ